MFLYLLNSSIEYGGTSRKVNVQAGYGLSSSINFWYLSSSELTQKHHHNQWDHMFPAKYVYVV
jgi:hypothetical protein